MAAGEGKQPDRASRECERREQRTPVADASGSSISSDHLPAERDDEQAEEQRAQHALDHDRHVHPPLREFADAAPPPPAEALTKFRDAVAMVVKTVRGLDAAGWQTPAPHEHPIQTVFGLVLVCTSHVNNHVGQMAYLVRQLGHEVGYSLMW